MSTKPVRVHILDPLGGAKLPRLTDIGGISQILEEHQNPYRIENWVIGREITSEQSEKWGGPVTGDIYLIIYYKDGKPVTDAVSKSIWEQAKAKLDKIW